MKKLLLFVLLIVAVPAFAVPVAYPVPNLHSCSGVFDLTVQTPVTLGNQNPNEFAAHYYMTEIDANSDVNPINNPESYTALESGQMIFIRVFNIFNGQFDTTSFALFTNAVDVPEFPDVTYCGSYALPPLEIGHYYTQPGGEGDLFPSGWVITTTRIIYIYSGEGDCASETSFHITINPLPVIQTPINLYACAETTFNLANLAEQIVAYNDAAVEVHFYHTMADATANVNAIENLQYAGTNNENVFVKVTDIGSNCYKIEDFHLHVQNCSEATISGIVRFDANGNGCNDEDPVLAGVTVVAIHNNDTFYAYTNESGEYQFSGLPTGEYHVFLLANGQPFNVVTPEIYTFNVTGDSAGTGNFCVTFNEYHDLGIEFYSSLAPVIGNNRGYILKIHNHGTVPASGTVNVTFDSDAFSVVNNAGGTVNGNTIDFAVNALAPGQTITLEIVLHVGEPPVAEAGDEVSFIAHLEYELDENLDNNHVVLVQTLVSSLDPNDIAVHEGALITYEQAQGYLHYTVRFQNTGTAVADTIRIENQLSPLLNAATFRPVASSHPFFVQRVDGNVTFRFNNINLPAEQDNEEASHGFITYEVKPMEGLTVDQLIENNANIYFDFNEAVVTNTVGTEIINLGTPENTSDAVVMYPNPAKEKLFLVGIQNKATLTVADLSGKMLFVREVNAAEGTSGIDVSNLSTGMYVIKIVSDGKTFNKKLIVQ
ncbi:DUF7619 domain-containing protein [Flavobacterium silvaticum]|uniref:T9SS type A sorting domain-containing protein n=1 Tax=Flavobacterium silvaticum TaxID=1852020 RepID=A0A972FR85_9FLAO|nr:T9SS type A sorting domain-containing protein [Flavobacterium silvaticum]NMH27023.1 T9SS type A sorting domain-containing protein [Flavobacterium silvaticum]